MPQLKFHSTHIHKGVLKVGVSLYPEIGSLCYPLHNVSKPVIPDWTSVKTDFPLPTDAIVFYGVTV